MWPKLTEENFLDVFLAYVSDNYVHHISEIENTCPYDLNLGHDDKVWQQVLVWYSCERKDHNGMTILDKFVNNFVDDERFRKKLLQIKDITYDKFLIRKSPDERNIILATSISDGREYAIEIMGTMQHVYTKDRSFEGRIHPWHNDGTYRTLGLLKVMMGEAEQLEKQGVLTLKNTRKLRWMLFGRYQDQAESIAISSKPKSTTLLKQFPRGWINAICISLKINKKLVKKEKIKKIAEVLTTPSSLKFIVDGLSENQKLALKLTLEKDGTIKHSILCKRVGEDDTDWYWDDVPSSVVGELRRLGLLIVGKKIIKNRNYKVAVIPSDVATQLTRYL